MKQLEEAEIEKLAVEIREFLLEHDMWQDVDIYFNGKRFGCRNPETVTIITMTGIICLWKKTSGQKRILSM